MDRAMLKEKAREQIKGNIGVLFGISVLAFIVMCLANIIPVVGSLVDIVVITPAFTIAIACIYLNMAQGVKPEIKELFTHFGEFGNAFLVSFLMSLFTILWSLLFIIPGIVKAYSYSQAIYVMADNPGIGPLEAINRSKEMMKGHKMELFILELSFIGWGLLCIITFGIAAIWVGPYVSATMTNFYNAVKPHSGIVEEPAGGPEF